MNEKKDRFGAWLTQPLSPKTETLLLGGVFLLAAVLRILRLSAEPFGINVDEAGAAYDAWCLAHYGVDRWLLARPVYLLNFGSGQSALYAYLLVPLVKLFGTGTAVLRIPAVVFGLLTLVFGTLLARRALGQKAGLVCAVLLALCPVFITQSRFGLDCFLMLGGCVCGIWCLVRATDTGKNSWFAVCGAVFGLCLYTYAISFTVLPLFLLLVLLYLLRCKKILFRNVISLGVPLALFATPLLCFVAVNTFQLESFSLLGFTIPRLLWYRGGEISLANIPTNILPLLRSWFWYDTALPFNALPFFCTLFLWTVPFTVWGMGVAYRDAWRSIKVRQFDAACLVTLFFTAQTVVGLLTLSVNANKVNAVYYSLAFFAVLGMRSAWRLLQKISLKKLAACAFLLAYFGGGAAFMGVYFTQSLGRPMTFFATALDIPLRIVAEADFDGQIYLDGKPLAQPYVYYLLSQHISPYDADVAGAGQQVHGNVSFYLPPETDTNGAYIMTEGSIDTITALRESGNFTECNYANYYVFIPVQEPPQ